MVDAFTQLSIQLAQIVLPIIIILCIIGNILNIIIFTRQSLRSYACSYYFLALAVNNLIYSGVLVYYLLVNGYQIDLKLYSDWWCKITQFIATGCPFLSPYFIVFASIDRFCASSRNVHLRNFSNTKIARWIILGIVILTVLFFVNTLVLNHRMFIYGKLLCSIETTIPYNAAYVVTQITLFAIVPPVFMILFGLLTIHNVSRTSITPVTNTANRRTEGQLIRMLLVQVITYLILNMPLCILYVLLVFPTGLSTTMTFSYAFMIAPFFFHLSFAMTFFLYTTSANVYRKELVRLMGKILPIGRGNQVGPQSNANTRSTRT